MLITPGAHRISNPFRVAVVAALRGKTGSNGRHSSWRNSLGSEITQILKIRCLRTPAAPFPINYSETVRGQTTITDGRSTLWCSIDEKGGREGCASDTNQFCARRRSRLSIYLPTRIQLSLILGTPAIVALRRDDA